MAEVARQPEANYTFQPLEQTTSETLAFHQQSITTTTTGEFIPSGDTTATLSFYSPPADGSNPYNYVEEPPAGVPRSNFGVYETQVKIHDLAAHPEFTPNLNDNAFQILSEPSSLTDFSDEKLIEDVYYREIRDLILRNVAGAKTVSIFDHTIRKSNPGASRAPVNRVHIDQTKKSGPERVRLHHSSDAETLLSDRVRIINVWRAINPPVVDHPLAYADAATVEQDDLVGVEHRYPTRTGETAGVKYRPRHRWWYKSGFGKDDVVLLQCFDNRGKESQVPHTAFTHPDERVDRKGRQSIEVRCLVFG